MNVRRLTTESESESSEEMQVMDSASASSMVDDNAIGQKVMSSASSASYISDSEEAKGEISAKVTLEHKKNNPVINEKFTKLRINDIPEHEDKDDDDEEEEKDTFIGRNVYKKPRSPVTIDEYLKANESNLIHFKALAKYYGVTPDLLKIPDCVLDAKDDKFTILTPNAKVESISATVRDKHQFIKFLVGELRRIAEEI